MIGDLHARVEFRRELEKLAAGDAPESTDLPALTQANARAFLDYHDHLRRRIRELESRTTDIRDQLVGLVSGDAHASTPESLVQALSEELRGLRSGQNVETAEMSRDLVSLRAELADSKRKLAPVLRYAYNLRKLVQYIYANESPSPAVARTIESLLRAGGVPLSKKDDQTAGAVTGGH